MSENNKSGGAVHPSAFYEKFNRHAGGAGLKAHSTHYCPGCGHGVAHKFLAESIEELGIKDKTIAISPVGCSVFMYYYMDVGNSQAPHGRAPMVAMGHKFANPGSPVVSYQGDGDLASIGLAEIVFAAQVGIPMAVIFINNAIYGMTGGQMAPTTLMGQKTATSPYGRQPISGQPFKMAELISSLDGPIYVERVGLFNAKERTKAKRAIKKAMKYQMENKGFAFVEVLAECPTHLKLDGLDSIKWLVDNMLPVFPLGVKKDLEATNPGAIKEFPVVVPTFEPKKVLDIVSGGQTDLAPKYASGFPSHIAKDDIALKLAGSGGDGAQTAAMLITTAAINEGLDSTHIPSYGPESRGGTSYADVHVAAKEVLSPAAHNPHILLAFNGPSVQKFSPTVVKGGYVLYDSAIATEVPKVDGVKFYGVPFSEIAVKLGNPLVKNIVALGALQAMTNLFPEETFLTAVRMALKSKPNLVALNEKAFWAGAEAIKSYEK
ncbi:MAG: 2-oxoacid:acceptor oxidoreductase family protein [Oligoflexia bacterium]|nr:2-oxoacid:acceptor oxidoreductase family protein [Oligoflexia bacterium]MBF0367349.1 2-oxoacid:acceptor oxidoreductase family protein [Oligoflexia bacterium]